MKYIDIGSPFQKMTFSIAVIIAIAAFWQDSVGLLLAAFIVYLMFNLP